MASKTKYKLNAVEMLEMLNAQWASTNDIAQIGSVGMNKAQSVKKEIIKDLNNKKIFVPAHYVPMKSVINYFGIDINYLKKITK